MAPNGVESNSMEGAGEDMPLSVQAFKRHHRPLCVDCLRFWKLVLDLRRRGIDDVRA